MRHALVRALVLALCVGQGAALKVFVSGAGGQTGQSVFRKMLARPEFSPVGVVRSEESKAALVESGVPAECVVVCDVADADRRDEGGRPSCLRLPQRSARGGGL